MATFDWVEAVDSARRRWQDGDASLARTVSDLEYVVDAAEAVADAEAPSLRQTWSELEIINALQLDGDVMALPAEVDELLAFFAAAVKRSAGA